MNKIPTAEEFSKNFTRLRSAVALKDLSDFAVEFAKLHVQAALEAAAENALVIKDLGENEEGIFNTERQKYFYDEMGYPMYVDNFSILNAYPDENIK